MGLFNKFFNQTRKPKGFLGKVMLLGVNSGGKASGLFTGQERSSRQKALDSRSCKEVNKRFFTETEVGAKTVGTVVSKYKRKTRLLLTKRSESGRI